MIKPDHSEAGSAPLSPRDSVSDRAHDTSNPNGGEEDPAPEDPLENWNHPYQWPDDEEPHEEPRLPGLPSPTRRHRACEEAPQPAQEEPSGSKKRSPDRPAKTRRGRLDGPKNPEGQGLEDGERKPRGEERGGGDKARARVGAGTRTGEHPSKGRTAAGQEEGTREGRPTGPGTRNREDDPPAAPGRKIHTSSVDGEPENPTRDGEEADSEGVSGDSGSVQYVESTPALGPQTAIGSEEELLDFLRGRPSYAPYLSVPEKLRKVLIEWRPILGEIPGFMALIQLVLFSTRRDEHGVVCDYKTVFRTFGLSESYAYNKLDVNSEDLLDLFIDNCDPDTRYKKHSHRDGLARKIDRTGIPEEILQMAHRLKLAPNSFEGRWVLLINGKSAERRNHQAKIHEERMEEADTYEPTIEAPPSAQIIQTYLNHHLDQKAFSHGSYGVMKKLDDAIERVKELKGKPPFDGEEKVDTALRTLYWLKQYPMPLYKPCDGSPRLKADHYNQLMNLSSEIRPAFYTKRDVELDAAKAHLASLARIARREGLSAPTVEKYLEASLEGADLWTDLADRFDAEKMPDPKARRKAAKISYSAVYGAGEHYMLKCIVDRYGELTGTWVGFDAVEGILEHEMIAEIFEVREALFRVTAEQGYLEDAYGRKIRPEDFPHKAEEKRVRSVLAYVAASYEQKLIAELFEEATDEMEWAAEKKSRRPRFKIWLYQADGVTIRVSSKQKPGTIIRRLQERFDRKAAELGLITRLEVDWRSSDA